MKDLAIQNVCNCFYLVYSTDCLLNITNNGNKGNNNNFIINNNKIIML